MAYFRQSAAQVLLALVSAISFLGTGLHALPGCNHFHELCHSGNERFAARTGSTSSDSDCCDDDADCPICRFLAIPWALTAPPAIVDCGLRFEPVVVAATPSPATASARPYGARAPPQLAAAV